MFICITFFIIINSLNLHFSSLLLEQSIKEQGDGEYFYFIMECCRGTLTNVGYFLQIISLFQHTGGSLYDHIRSKPLPEPVARKCLAQLGMCVCVSRYSSQLLLSIPLKCLLILFALSAYVRLLLQPRLSSIWIVKILSTEILSHRFVWLHDTILSRVSCLFILFMPCSFFLSFVLVCSRSLLIQFFFASHHIAPQI